MMIELEAKAKINWILYVTGKRNDGYHELDMLMQTIALHDGLTLEKARETTLFVDGTLCPTPETNLVFRAVRALEQYTGRQLPVRMQLTKHIPSMAGLGGGSSDCAAAINGLDRLYNLGLRKEEKESIGVTLGADVPFFFTGGLCRVRSIGEKVERIKGGKSNWIVLEHVGKGLSTKEVFAQYDRLEKTKSSRSTDNALRTLLEGDFSLLKQESDNDLEKAACEIMAGIRGEINRLYESGALFARMSGSGSAVYGVYENEERARNACLMIPNGICTYTTE